MFLVAYFVLVVAAGAAIARRHTTPSPTILRVSRFIQVIAIAAGIGAVVGGLSGLESLAREAGHSPSDVPGAWILWSSLVIGGLFFAVGSSRWQGNLALKLRATGWILATAALAIPSTLTLALPIAAALVLTLSEFPTHRPRQPAEGSANSPA